MTGKHTPPPAEPKGQAAAPDPSGPVTLAVDTGGTFTDAILLEGGGVRRLKLPSTPDDPAEAVLEAVARLVPEGRRFTLLHGSTVATNALLERRGARVVLVTNRGFEDVVEIGRQARPQLYALVGHRPPPLVAREDRVGIAGRMGAAGDEVEAVDEAELDALAARGDGAESFAVCLLHSYANDAHERAVAQALAAVDRPVSLSSALLREFREYERTSTTVVNAYVAPKMAGYLGRLDREAGSVRTAVMGSGGGTLSLERAVREPVQTVLSGPAGGVVGALTWGRRAGHDHVISFDMGGTSTDVSLAPGRLLHTRELEIDGVPVALPVLDIHTVGAGGGSVAWIDAGGALRVGPRSAGAAPGPVAYGGGGREVTVTDAHVWLGRLPADAFLGGERTLDRAAVEDPLRRLADGLDSSLEAAAEGILSVADSAMERALRVISVERGHDPAGFALVAFGGAGALHAAGLAERLGVPRVLVPPAPGLLSAWGILSAPLSREASRTVLVDDDGPAARTRVSGTLDALEARARDELRADGAGTPVRVERSVEARYRGQSYELGVPAEDWVEAFHAAHALRYGHARRDRPVQAVTLRAVASAPGAALEPERLPAAAGPPPLTPHEFRESGGLRTAHRVRRRDLRAGHDLPGPLVVVEYSATTWVPDGWRLRVDASGVLHLTPV